MIYRPFLPPFDAPHSYDTIRNIIIVLTYTVGEKLMYKLTLLFIAMHTITNASLPNSILDRSPLLMSYCLGAKSKQDSQSIEYSCKELHKTTPEATYQITKNNFKRNFEIASESYNQNIAIIINSMPVANQKLAKEQVQIAQKAFNIELAQYFAEQAKQAEEAVKFLHGDDINNL
jgi:hypothetical protein